ncbi:hypothetical protein METBIDRAFT_79658 [Metschnikowia bicuspidata var. bicuspidata NRRL YB-4993]|uniref:C2 domain-containing protein n=1 Tax=Metschnikowia bicuspidata var. bicuspidata NRRL YB-4993 TaxID=869754 RepID=A0A1A0H6X6_9ASCO|nr:hypothetical protein METBIDRAFT_79658 [Metschnikowia bicuspidata var. bicuspidata NRRL YB-4993]OBA19662.1 hypothetical protein METBIDRAFT_79658 [Metschnikowia bicuspidata var. bicuspidata NRRL YB-4993]
MKFVSTANKEVIKMGLIPSEETSAVVFCQAETFIGIIIKLVQKDKNSDALVAKLNEHRASLSPLKSPTPSFSVSSSISSSSGATANSILPAPSFELSDIDQSHLALLKSLFAVDSAQLQQDILRLKSYVNQKALSKDIEQVLFYVGKDIGSNSPASFATPQAYEEWKQRETALCDLLAKKYPVPAPKKLLPAPLLPPGEEFYIMPLKSVTVPFFVTLCKLCLLDQRKKTDTSAINSEDILILTNKSKDLLMLCGRLWRIDALTKAVCFYTAAHLSGILIDPFFSANAKNLCPILLESTRIVLQTCKRVAEDGGLDWEEKHKWTLKDQEEWANNLGFTFSELFYSIKDSLGAVLSRTIKPKFGTYLAFLADYIETDPLFCRVEATNLPKKWEKRLTKALIRTSESLYAEYLAKLPRDNTVSVTHVLNIADCLVEDVKLLQKRYKNPLLGFLNVSKTHAAVVMGMFASDSENILRHIIAHINARDEFLSYADALEVYKSICEIRSIYQQVSPSSPFAFNLEKFFFVYLQSWVSESSEKIKAFVNNALLEDSFQPIDIEDDEKKYSTSVQDIFTFIRQYLKILADLNWQDEYQLALIYTTLIKSISSCCLHYATEISEMIMNDLNREVEKQDTGLNPKHQSGWLAEVKSIVNNIQLGNQKIDVEPFNFTSRTCIGLNNLNAMIQHLSKMEQNLNPEEVSAKVQERNPGSRQEFTSHVFSIRVVKAENLKSSTESSNIKPYLTLIDTLAKKRIAKTRTMDSANPEWDEEFEISVEANSAITLSTTVWEERLGSHGVCGRALIQLEPRKFKHDGIPQDVYLDLDPDGRLLVEIAVENEREDAIFAMGRAHRTLSRSQQRIIKMIVAKFSEFIRHCVSRTTLKSVCGGNGNVRPSQAQMDEAMMPLYTYLNVNLLVLAQYLTKDLLTCVMLEAWKVIVSCADELLLPKLTSARGIKLLGIKGKVQSSGNMKVGWQSAVTSAVANVTNSLSLLGFGKTLTNNEIETVIGWLNFLCFDFFYNEGNGPPIHDLKNEQYQSLLLIPVYYDKDIPFLIHEIERLSPAFLQTLREKNNVFAACSNGNDTAKLRSKAGSIARTLTIQANATANARAIAAKEAEELQHDPLVAQTSAENIILRLLLVKDEKLFVSKRLEQRERLSHTIATERLAKAAAEGTFFR